ncbi:MAG: bifunctional uroporphyrinogen-III synthetase/response regulator domain protein [Deltaproteobacteria bacterium]|nr:bifunctional uroporphyrinogen-III synthetase/response regulator domain protein [Deltaproteobacteria bacterium]
MGANEPASAQPQGLAGLRLVAFESRRAQEMAELIRRHGGEPIIAPSVQEVPLSDNPAAFELLKRLEQDAIDIVVLLTGVGLRTLAEMVAAEWPRARLAAALARATLVVRGNKPAAALRDLGLQPGLLVPEPNTWREVLTTLDARLPVAGKRLAVLEYGVPNQELIAALLGRGADVLRVPVYRWALPDDVGPLRAALQQLCAGQVDVALFTSATQVYHLLEYAATEKQSEPLRAALVRVLIASIGPICSEALRQHGLIPDLESEHGKMGPLVSMVARMGRAALERKRCATHGGPVVPPAAALTSPT